MDIFADISTDISTGLFLGYSAYMAALTEAQKKAMVEALRGAPASKVDARLVGGAQARPVEPRKPRGFIIGTRG